MPTFGKNSEKHLATCCPLLPPLARRIVKRFDCSVVYGRRGKKAQDHAFDMGWTSKKYPSSLHNVEAPKLSRAIDLVPWPIDWNDIRRNYYFSGYVRGIAEEIGIPLRHGSDWDGDYDINDQTLDDPCHFEVVARRKLCEGVGCSQRCWQGRAARP
ncbi:MAG: M15 family peptidase [bacterium]